MSTPFLSAVRQSFSKRFRNPFQPRFLTRTVISGSSQPEKVSQLNVEHAHLRTDDSSRRGRVPLSIWEKTSAQLHLRPAHPLNTLRQEIQDYLQTINPSMFTIKNDLSPVVSTRQCFDDLLVPPDHVSRAPSDTYYIDDQTILRTHMTAHDASLLRDGHEAFVLCGDVYRRDTVDRTHYPVFHQIDAVRLFEPNTDEQVIISDLQSTLTSLARHLFGKEAELRWVNAYFPFTEPSFELEVQWQGEWLELLGCGLLRAPILSRADIPGNVQAWAFGLGLERLAMVLFSIPDIRLFWSKDPRFLHQFDPPSLGHTFKPFSVYPSIEKHISFWVEPDGNFHENDVHEAVRSLAGDLVENVTCIDCFERDERVSLCFSVVFRSMERNLTHEEINKIYHELRCLVSSSMPVTLR